MVSRFFFIRKRLPVKPIGPLNHSASRDLVVQSGPIAAHMAHPFIAPRGLCGCPFSRCGRGPSKHQDKRDPAIYIYIYIYIHMALGHELSIFVDFPKKYRFYIFGMESWGGCAPPRPPLHFRGAPPLELPIAKGCRSTLGQNHFWKTCFSKMTIVVWGNKAQTSISSKMAPQAKPLC
jgi:hypothetical protein